MRSVFGSSDFDRIKPFACVLVVLSGSVLSTAPALAHGLCLSDYGLSRNALWLLPPIYFTTCREKEPPDQKKKRGSNREERGCKNPILLPSSSPPSSTFPPFPSTPFSLIKIEVTVFPLPNRRLLHGPKGVYCKGHYIRREYYCGKSRLVAGRERSQEQASATSVCRRT